MYVSWAEKNTACTPIYAEAFGAKRHLDILLKDLEFEIIDYPEGTGLIDDKRVLVAENGIRIRCSLLQDILDHVDSTEEETWEMEPRHIRSIEAFRYGEPVTGDSNTEIRNDRKKFRRAERRKKNTSPRKPREIPTGMITVAIIAESLNILPREARARLRKANVTKPTDGWMWPDAEAESIKELIARG